MPRTEKPTFICDLPVRTTVADERALGVRLEAARHLFNTCLQEGLRVLALMRESRAWQAARAMPRTRGKDEATGKPLPNKERTAAFKACIERFDFKSSMIDRHAVAAKNACWLRDHLTANETQTIGLRAFQAVQRYAFGKSGRPRFKGRNRLHSIEGKTNAAGIRFKPADTAGPARVEWSGLCLPVRLDRKDKHGWQALALEHRVKYVRLVRRRIKGRDRWFAQLVLDGSASRKAKNVVGVGDVGLDLGPSTIATVSETAASLAPFCPGVTDRSKELRRVQRAMDRSRRATNPDAFDEQGQVKPGPRRWVHSGRYRVLADRAAEIQRRLAAERKRDHGERCNATLAMGDIIKTEKLSYKAFQRTFGRSVGRRAPGLFIAMLKRKAAGAGAAVIEFNTRTTRLSQYDHKSDSYAKKPLKQRWHVFADGGRVQRDLYSAWLARFVEGDALDASRCAVHWEAAEPLLRAASSDHNPQAGAASPSPHVPGHQSVRADRPLQKVGRARRRKASHPGCAPLGHPGVEAGAV